MESEKECSRTFCLSLGVLNSQAAGWDPVWHLRPTGLLLR